MVCAIYHTFVVSGRDVMLLFCFFDDVTRTEKKWNGWLWLTHSKVIVSSWSAGAVCDDTNFCPKFFQWPQDSMALEWWLTDGRRQGVARTQHTSWNFAVISHLMVEFVRRKVLVSHSWLHQPIRVLFFVHFRLLAARHQSEIFNG